MEHLNKYPKYKRVELTEEDIADIKDVFQDLIDEHDIEYDPDEKITPEEFSSTKTYNISKTYTDSGALLKIEIEIYFNTKIISTTYSKLENDIKNFVTRLKNMGFMVYTKDHGYGKDIEIMKANSLYTFEKFNEKDMILTQENLDDIKDIFQDIIDDFDLHDDINADIENEEFSGIKTYNYNYLDESSIEIELWYDISKGNKLSKEILKFVKRLRSMGFYVRKLNTVHDYVTIQISTKKIED